MIAFHEGGLWGLVLWALAVLHLLVAAAVVAWRRRRRVRANRALIRRAETVGVCTACAVYVAWLRLGHVPMWQAPPEGCVCGKDETKVKVRHGP